RYKSSLATVCRIPRGCSRSLQRHLPHPEATRRGNKERASPISLSDPQWDTRFTHATSSVEVLVSIMRCRAGERRAGLSPVDGGYPRLSHALSTSEVENSMAD